MIKGGDLTEMKHKKSLKKRKKGIKIFKLLWVFVFDLDLSPSYLFFLTKKSVTEVRPEISADAF